MDNFPEDNLFTFVSVQEMDQECQDWQAQMTEAQTRVNAAGREMQLALQALQSYVVEYAEILEKGCDKNCHTSKCGKGREI